MDQNATLIGTKVDLGPDHIVLHGTQLPHPKRCTARQFSAHMYCGQTVAHLSYCCMSTCCILSQRSKHRLKLAYGDSHGYYQDATF